MPSSTVFGVAGYALGGIAIMGGAGLIIWPKRYRVLIGEDEIVDERPLGSQRIHIGDIGEVEDEQDRIVFRMTDGRRRVIHKALFDSHDEVERFLWTVRKRVKQIDSARA